MNCDLNIKGILKKDVYIKNYRFRYSSLYENRVIRITLPKLSSISKVHGISRFVFSKN